MSTFTSDTISRAEYDALSQILRIWFVRNGLHYDYRLVPEVIFDGLCSASDPGAFFRREIQATYELRCPGFLMNSSPE